MWAYVEMLSPILTISLAAALCLTVVSFILSHQAPPHPKK